MGEPPLHGEQGQPITVLVADDQPLLRHSLTTLLDAQPDIRVVAQAADGNQAVELVQDLHPDIALLDIRMPHCDGLEATRRICRDPDLAGVHVCVLTMFELDDYLFGALRAGASGFLLKDAEPEELVAALRRIRGGEQLLAPAALRRVIGRALSGPPATQPLPASLTGRETEVLRLIGRGLSNSEIEATLFISRGTLKSHISHLLTKLQARDRVQLVIAAYEAGLVSRRP